MDAERSQSGRLARGVHHGILLALLALAGAATALVLGALVTRREWLQSRWGAGWWLHASVLALSTCVAGAAIVSRIRRWRSGAWGDVSLAPFRLAFVALISATIVQMIWLHPFRLVHTSVCLGYGAGLFALAILLGRGRASGDANRVLRVLDFVVFNACLVLLLSELALRSWNRFRPSALLTPPAVAGGADVETRALRPGSRRLGFPVNADGFFDRDVPHEPRAERLVVCIGDSFSVGIVPHHRHYTTLCERQFDGLEVYNVGVVGAGPPGYLTLLERFATPLQPDAIVIALFVGNDVAWPGQSRATHAFDRWLDRDSMLVYQVPRRLARLAEARRGGATLGETPSFAENLGRPLDEVLSIEEIEERMSWLDDPLRERPSFSDTTFLDIERGRAQSVCWPGQSDYSFVFASLERLRAAAGTIPIAVLIVPDEFQVDDELWREVLDAKEPLPLDRDLPQRTLSTWLTKEGIAFVDLLPALRALPPLTDGRIHAYQLRDTHFNARGNVVAADGLAELVVSCLGLPRRSVPR